MRRLRLLLVLLALGSPGLASAHPAIDARLAAIRQEIARRPADAALRLSLAQALQERGDAGAARAELSSALALDPELAAAHLALSRLELRAGRPAEALAAADRFLGAKPGHPQGLLARARALDAADSPESAGAWSAALDALERDGRPQPDAYLAASRRLGASAIDRATSKLGPVPGLLLRAIALEREAGRLDEALRRCAQSDQLLPSAEWLVLRGEILAGSGRGDEARAEFEGALARIASMPERARASRFARDLQERARSGAAR